MTFLEKYQLLKKSVPVQSVMIREGTIECEYVDLLTNSRNCNYCFDSSYLIDSIYTSVGAWSKKLVDCTFVTESEKCYKCIDSNKCYNCTYLMDCNSCTDCHFSAFLNSSSDCFGCVSLTHKKHCLFNKQYTKEGYFKKLNELKKESPEKIFAQMLELKKQIPHPASQQKNNENCPYGDYIYDSKNSFWCFNSYSVENSGYTFSSVNAKNCWDIWWSGSGDKKLIAERCYELVDSGRSTYDCAFLAYCLFCMNCYYGAYLKNCTDCFGCVGLTNKNTAF